jgi:protein SCO1/2
MTDRRNFLSDLTEQKQQDCDCARPAYADYFPNALVLAHDGRKALFYNDLLRGKVAIINCISIGSEPSHRVTENLVRAQRLLGERVGRDVFMYSITTDPENDTPRLLRAFAEKAGVRPGWLFLTGPPRTIHSLRARLFADAGGHHKGAPLVRDCSLGVIRYGNEPAGLWGSCSVRTEPEWIVERLSWVEARRQPGGYRRGGPFPETNRS